MTRGRKLVPLRSTFMKVEAGSSRPQFARVNTAPVVIVCVRLSCLPEVASPAVVVHAALRSHYPDDMAEKLVYIDAPYDLQCVRDGERFRENIDTKLAVLERYESVRG